MKKFFTLAIAVATIGMASAQSTFTCNPSTAEVIKKGVATVDYLVLSDAAIADFREAGATVTYIGANGENENLYIWEDTMTGYTSNNLGVDEEEVEYPAIEVTNKGWSGAGYNSKEDGPGLNFSHFNDETRFHLAYMTPSGTAPASVAIILLNGDEKPSNPGSFALGAAFDDNGVIYNPIAPVATEEWQGIDLSLGDVKKLFPDFNYIPSAHWTGNVMSWLAGGVAGRTIAFDTVYFYNTTDNDSGVAGVEADATLVITENTINSTVAGIEVYNMQGAAVKSVAGTVCGINNLAAGVYVAKSGNVVKKFIVK